MCAAKCIIVAFALSISVVSSWDIAITTGDQLEFYTNKTKEKDEVGRFRDLTALAHDAVHNLLLFVDKQGDNASIFSYNLATKKSQPLVGRRSHESIQGLAFDPVSGRIFWPDTEDKVIYWTSLWSRSKTDIYGKVLLNMTHEIPRDIAVDSCRGYIYWTNINVTKPTIERARLDGTGREVIIDKDIYMPVSIAVDQRTKRLYWVDDKEGIHYTIETSDLDGGDRKKVVVGIHHHPNTLTVSKDSLYWVDWAYKTVWKIDKDAPPYTEPEEFLTFYNGNTKPFGIVANYNINDQIEGVPECRNVWEFSQKSKINDTFDIPTDSTFDVGLFCLHGEGTGNKCKCIQGYTGDRCEINVCQNFCLNGDCNVGSEGQPTCRCKKGFAGLRCELNECNGYCLNSGECSNDSDKPTCKCPDNYEGERCEVKKIDVPTTVAVKEICNCTNNASNSPGHSQDVPYSPQITSNSPQITSNSPPISTSSSPMTTTETLLVNDDFVESCAGWDGVRDPILMVLGVLCGLLSLLCAILTTKVLQLKRRPRIKKRIIVNKNVTPLTARPDQCEITIENCCNMNICETPCFEPKSTIRPNLLNTKQGKEEKRNLIANMENPDDMY